MIEEQMMRDSQKGVRAKTIDAHKELLTSDLAENLEDFYARIRPLIGPEVALGVVDKEDLLSYTYMDSTILELFNAGLEDDAVFLMTISQIELKRTPSIEGIAIQSILAQNKYEYTQRIEQYEHPYMPEKKSLFGRRKAPPPERR